MVMRSVFFDVVMVMLQRWTSMIMCMLMFMRMTVSVFMRMFVRMGCVSVSMFVLMVMLMFMRVKMCVFMISFHVKPPFIFLAPSSSALGNASGA